MSYCSKCGAEINPGARYCSKCGNPVNTEQTGKKEEFQDNGKNGDPEKPFQETFSRIIEFVEKIGERITTAIDKVLHTESDKQEEAIASMQEVTRQKNKKKKWDWLVVVIIIVAVGVGITNFSKNDESKIEADKEPFSVFDELFDTEDKEHGNNDGSPPSIEEVFGEEVESGIAPITIPDTEVFTNMESAQDYLCYDSENVPIRINEIQITPPNFLDFIDIQWNIVNQTHVNIKKAAFGIAAWDINGLPLTLEPLYSFLEEPVCRIYTENIPDGGSEECVAEVSYEDIGYINIILLEYEDFDGNTWTNPYETYYEEMASKPIDETTIAYTVEY